jgi:TPR repeat protein
VLTGVVGRIDEHAVRLYEVAAEQGSGYAALRAGDAAFYGGIGTSRIVCLPA